LKRFARVIYETGRWANTHRSDSAKILVKYAQLDPATVREMARCRYAENLDVRLIQPALDAAARYGVLDRPMQASEMIDAD
jgi:ABC-type nitrate/sulfonate/bicarbonate transport system substrate-binding protein